MAFEKGKEKTGGRIKGTPNELTKQMKTVKETVLSAFHELQNDPKVNIEEWGKQNPTEFYKIAAKLIPTEISANVELIKKELPPFMKSNEKQS